MPEQDIKQERSEDTLTEDSIAHEKEKEIGNRVLPIWGIMPEIVKTIKDNNRLILVSETGSGKTTQIPQALWEAGFTEEGKKIIVVENRVAVAVETAKRVAQEMNGEAGDKVGYITGPEKKSKTNSDILFVTNGIFKNMIQNDPQMKQASVVIFDEFDERYLLSDIGLALVEKAQLQGADTKFILMSATLNTQKFSEHFEGAPIIEAKGRPYPVESFFSSEYIRPTQMPEKAAELVSFINQSKDPGDILIFMPGKQEISDTIKAIKQRNIPNSTTLALHSELSPQERQIVFDSSPDRKIIVSTNIAERGLTIDGVKYVIDSGQVRATEYDPDADTTKLVTTSTAQDSLVQRKGRAGRTQPGECYFLITEEEFNKRPASTKPEIMRTSLRDIVLQIKAMGYSREDDPIRLIDSPEKQSWKTAKEQLRLLGALDSENETKLSEFGQKLAELSCDPREGTMLLKGCEAGCGREMAIMAAIRTARRLLYKPRSEQEFAEAAHRQFRISNQSDLLNLLNVYEQAERNNFDYSWCKGNYVSFLALREIRQNYSQFVKQVTRLGYKINTEKAKQETICRSILEGFPDKIFKSTARGWYENMRTEESALLGRDSNVNGELIIANELIKIQTKQGNELPLITLATNINPEWMDPPTI